MEDKTELVVDINNTLKEAMKKIDKNGLGIVFVVQNDNEFYGTLTDGDIRRHLLAGNDVSETVETAANTEPVVAYSSWSDSRFEQEINSDVVSRYAGKNGVLTVPVLNESDEIISVTHVDEHGNQLSTRNVSKSVETVLVIGGAGYLGSHVCTELLERGYKVKVLDNLLFGTVGIEQHFDDDNFTLMEGDMRSIDTVVEGIKGSDAVILLAGLVGDPASAINPEETLELNYHSTRMIAEVCKYYQVNRFIFASTCSVYGQSTQPTELLSEDAKLNPVSLYAKTNIQSEKALLDLRDENFSPTMLRMATLYGLSPRMRFDLVVNIMSAKAHTEGVVPIFGGDQFRPNVHVRDAARAYVKCLEAPIEDVDGEVFNVGSNEQNYQIGEIGEKISECFPDASIDWQRQKEDERSYQVDFTKIEYVLGYTVENTIKDAAVEIKEAFEEGVFEDYEKEKYSNYRTTEKYLD